MKLHLNLSLRRALLAALAALSSLTYTASAGVVDERYDLQYYLDFARNKGMFSAGETNIGVFFKDGTHITNNVIPLMPNFDSYGQTVAEVVALPGVAPRIASNGGTNLVSSQFVYGAKHVHNKIGNTDVAFLSENASNGCIYDSANLDNFGHDSALQRLTKLVTDVVYTPMADDAFMSTIQTNDTWIYRLGNGGAWGRGESINTYDNTLGGVVNLSVIRRDDATGDWYMEGWARYNDTTGDTLTPLDIGTYFGDSGSPSFAWDGANNRFVFIAAMWASGVQTTLPNWYLPSYNPSKAVEIMDKYTVAASFSGTDTIVWGVQDAATGQGSLTQGSAGVVYTGKGSDNTLADTLGLSFSTESDTTQTLELQGNVNMGAGALTFVNGKWRLTELANNDFTLTGAGLDIQKGAEVTWELTGSSSQEIRKVGEGTLTISGTGNNASTLVVGGGTTVYEVTRDANGTITGCTLGNAGETRLNRTGGYAASSVRLEGGVAILVLMQDGQFKTNSVAGDTFSFGNAGGLLNLNGHDLSWGVINQDGSGKGARIGNFTPLGEQTPGLATFTYTGTGTFAGCFMDEAGSGKGTAQLAVNYNKSGGTWYLTGNHSNAGGFNVQAGTMVLQGTNTPHVMMSDSADWTYASIVGSDVSVKSGATFQLSHHALMQGNVTVENGGTFILNQTVNAASESINGSLRQDMSQAGIKALIGNVTLKASGSGVAQMEANISSPVTTIIDGSINLDDPDGLSYRFISLVKKGDGILSVTGAANLFGVSIEEGGLVIGKGAENSNWYNWTIGEKGFLAAVGADNIQYHLTWRYINPDSKGVLALTADQATQLTGDAITNGLYIGAYGDKPITYGTADAVLSANAAGQWLLGGGTGTLQVDFRLTGKNDLIIGNEWSSGTVHLTNTANDFTGDIYIKGLGNMLTYDEGALGSALVALSYGNILGLHDASQLTILKESTRGILALRQDMSLDMTNVGDRQLSIAAQGDVTLTQTITVADDTYRFGGYGNLTLDNELSGAAKMLLDGQGNTGSSVTFANENAYSGAITAGGALNPEAANSSGSIDIHVADEQALAAVASIELQKGATLHTDGQNLVVNNLTAQYGSSIQNKGETATLLQLNVEQGQFASIANGVLADADNSASLALVKTGAGTLDMGANTSWSGGLTIMKGQVNASIANGGIGAEGASVYVKDGATLNLTATEITNYRDYAKTRFVQSLSGDGEVVISNGADMLFLTQTTSFEGQVKVTGNTRLYITTSANITSQESFSTSQAFDKATIVVESGSQARVTPSLYSLSGRVVESWADYVIAGSDYKGASSAFVQSQHDGALVIDGKAIVWGNVTLAEDAMIASWSKDPSNSQNYSGSYAYRCLNSSTDDYANRYGIINKLGGIIRGQILGEGKTLIFGGNEGMTITADSANTYGNLVIDSGNGHNTNDKFALCLDGGRAINQTSTALGKGTVTLKDGLILRLAGTGVANNSDVVYTYENNMSVGEDATLQSHNITNRLTGTVSMSGNSLNLATANGGVLELAGGLDGKGTLNVGSGSVVSLGAAAAVLSAESPQFSGSIVAGDGADITLASSSVLSTVTSISGTGALTLRFGGAEDYTLGGISGASALTLHFDFTNTPMAGNDATWSTLNSSVSATTTTIALDLNLFNDIEKGNYTLISSAGEGTFYQLADTMNGRLNLVTNDAGALVLTVDADNRLFWRTDGTSSNWNTTDANWYSDAAAGKTAFRSDANVMLDETGVAVGNSASSRETIGMNEDLTVGTLGVQEAAYELSGSGSLSGKSLTVGNGGDLKLSNAGGSTFSERVVVNNAALTAEGNTLTAEVRAEDGGSVTLQGSVVLNGNLAVSDAEATIRQSTLAGNITTDGSGKLTLDAANISGERTMRFETGTLTASSGATLSGAFTFAPKQTVLQAEGMAVSFGSLRSSAALDVDTLAMNGASLTLTHAAGTMTQIDSITGNGTLVKETAGNLSLGAASLSGLTLKGGGVSSISGKVTVSGQFSLGKEIVNLVDGADVTVGHYTSGNTANSQPTQLSIGTGASLTVTGSNDADATNASLLLAHWKESASFLLLNGGTLNAKNTSVLMGWDSGATFEATSGTANLKGIRFSAQRSNSESFILGSAESGTARINLGSAGISGIGTDDKVLLGNGTIGATSDFSVSGSGVVQLVATTGSTVFDTNGHKITVSTALNGAGNITKQGEGTLLISGSGSAYSGNIAVNAGALAVDATGKDILTSAASVAVGNGATLDLSALDFTETANQISVSMGAHISFAENSTVAFGAMEAGRVYSVFDISGGVLDGWSDLSASNFTIDGVRLSDMGRVALNYGMTGDFSYTIEDGWDLVWNGGADKQIWNQKENNAVWQTTRPDDITGGEVTTNVGYVNNDNVVFNSSADLELEGNIRVNKMTVADGVSLKTSGSLTITGALNVGSNVSWSFSGDTSLSFTETQLKDFAALEVGEGATLTMTEKVTAQNNTSTAFNKVSGAGNVVLNLSADNGVGFNFGKITGDITVATGRLQVNTSTFNAASDIYLTTSASQLVFNGTGTELKNDVVLGASTTFHGNSGCSGTISGTISGSLFGLTKAGGGSLTLAGQTTLGSLLINTGSVTVSNGMTLDGTDRLQLEAGTKLLLTDGASITRTNEAASWIRGSMEVQENASATFTSIDDVHLSYDNGNNKGSIVLRENSRLAMDVDILSFYNGSSISMETKAELQLTKSKAHISNRGAANATITASSTGARSAQTYSMSNSNFEVSNAHFKSVATDNATLSNKLVNSSVENAGSGLLTVSNAANSITDVYASAGDMAVMQQAAGLNLDELVVASGKTVSAYTGTEATAAAEANVTVNKRAEFGAGAVLNANLTLAAGATLEVGVGGLTMGSTLTLSQGLTLGADTLSRVQGLSVGESATLFRGVDGLKLGSTSYTSITTDDSILASPWFTNLTGDQYALTYTGTDNGSLSITMMSAAVPEPTTATLSLLALAALAARRRRK